MAAMATMAIRAFALANSLHAMTGLYVLNHSYVGPEFFSKWNFFDGPDPTHGHVDFVTAETAVAAGLVSATAERVYIGADMTSRTGSRGRRSVRIESKAAYNSGLFVVSLDHMPTGCGLWPALWMVGQGPGHWWPDYGEFDIIEGVHMADRVQTTLHTRDGCDQWPVTPGKDFLGTWQRGSWKSEADNCYVRASGQWPNQGCAQSGPPDSMGMPFNAKGGGTFAAEWGPLAGHIRTWFWPAGAEPADLLSGLPDPSSWGVPFSFFRLTPHTCPRDHFQDMRLVIDLTFCGDWAGATYSVDCPVHAARMTCEELVTNHPEEMAAAYWSIHTLDVYQWHQPTPEPSTVTSTATTTTTSTPKTTSATNRTITSASSTKAPLRGGDFLHQALIQLLSRHGPQQEEARAQKGLQPSPAVPEVPAVALFFGLLALALPVYWRVRCAGPLARGRPEQTALFGQLPSQDATGELPQQALVAEVSV